MKQREERRRVTTPARMRTDAGWSDVTIRDISSRGVGLRASNPPRRGDYVELCRHNHRLVGRIMWSDGERFGVLLSDAIAVEDLLASRAGWRPGAVDRRRRPRHHAAARRLVSPRVAVVSLAARSRHASRLMQFAAIAVCAGLGALIVAEFASRALGDATAAVSAGLSRPEA